MAYSYQNNNWHALHQVQTIPHHCSKLYYALADILLKIYISTSYSERKNYLYAKLDTCDEMKTFFKNFEIREMSHIIETKQLIWRANQLTGCYIMGQLVVNGLTLTTQKWNFPLKTP